MKKLLRGLLIFVLVIAVGLYVARNSIARRAVEVGVKKATGVPIEIASVDVGVFTSKVDVRGIVLKNPADFPEPNFAELPQLYVDYRLPSIIVRRNHVNELFIHIDHLYLVKNNKEIGRAHV